jgi:hypothetical protein
LSERDPERRVEVVSGAGSRGRASTGEAAGLGCAGLGIPHVLHDEVGVSIAGEVTELDFDD